MKLSGPAKLRRAADHPLVHSLAVVLLLLAVVVHYALIVVTTPAENPLSRAAGRLAHRYVDPLFKQNWKLFAPSPLDGNISVLARGRVANQSDWTPWVNINRPIMEKVRSRPLTSLALPRLTLLRAAVYPLTILFFENKDPAKRKEIFARWTKEPGAKPREIVALERTASAYLLDRFPDANLQTIQVRLTLTRFPSYPGRQSDKRTPIRLTLPEVKATKNVSSIPFP